MGSTISSYFSSSSDATPVNVVSNDVLSVVSDEFQLDKLGGLDDHIEYFRRSIILPLTRPKLLEEWGVSPPKGILLYGPPGTGKTFLAKSLVNELSKQLSQKISFFYHKGNDVCSMWFGQSEKNLRKIFSTAKQNAPSVIFFDEIDGLCLARNDLNGYMNASVVTCFLGQMDGLKNGEVFVLAATNRLAAVDPAVRRPGRFDKYLTFGPPDEIARKKIIQIHTRNWQKEDQPEADLIMRLAKKTEGFTGADLSKLCKDVVHSAIEANNGVFDENVKVTEKDWLHAMSGMQRTATNIFGSDQYIPTKPSQLVSKLIKPIIDKALQYISPMFLQSSDEGTTTILKSLLIYITPQQSKSFLNEQIIPGLLGDEKFNKMSFFEISSSSILHKLIYTGKPTIFSAIHDVILQAKEFQTRENCSVVVVVKNINELLTFIHQNKIPTKLVLKSLAQIRGPRMLLLATSSGPLEEINEPRITELFSNRVMKAEKPRESELKDFFQFVLEQKVDAQQIGEIQNVLDDISKKAARLANKDDYQLILNFAIELQKHFENGLPNDLNQLKKNFTDTLDDYQKSKFRE